MAVFFSHGFPELTWSDIAATKEKAVHVHVHVNVHVNVNVYVDVDVDVDVVVNGSCHAKILSKRRRIFGLVVRSSQAATKPISLAFLGVLGVFAVKELSRINRQDAKSAKKRQAEFLPGEQGSSA